MTPLQKVAMGLVIVLVDASFAGWDAVPDPVGWALVVAGVLALRGRVDHTGVLLGLALLSGLVALAVWPPAVTAGLDPSLGWLLSLPQVAFSVVLCAALAPHAGSRERSFRVLTWVLVAVGLAPAVVYGGQVDALVVPAAGLAVLTEVVLVYLLFAVSRQAFATADPGPLDRSAPDRTDRTDRTD